MLDMLWVVLFAAAMGYVEAAVVVYLRDHYYPDGFPIPVQLGRMPIRFTRIPEFEGRMPQRTIRTEIGREAATIVMLLTLALIGSNTFWQGLGVFLLAFGVWDITYYLFLKLLIRWPESLKTLDVLFLIPVPWIGPVWLPVSVSAVMIACGVWLMGWGT
ncbi:MAG: hypothetical protein NZ520_06980 [bacterium]|nr:hypothetical protein [bacterium]MDW8104824.1 hypothetical protein [Armatimonadota bacterium]